MFSFTLFKESSCFCGSSIACVRVSDTYLIVAEVMCCEWRRRDWFKKGTRKIGVVPFDSFPNLVLIVNDLTSRKVPYGSECIGVGYR